MHGAHRAKCRRITVIVTIIGSEDVMALFQKKPVNQVRYFRALEGRYLALAYLTSHKQQAEF